MTEFLDVPGGRIAYDVSGSGPLLVLPQGVGDRRRVYRFLAAELAQAGYRVANADLRGHGESSMGWAPITRTGAAGQPGNDKALMRSAGARAASSDRGGASGERRAGE
jgi:alpha-beta hydrolase superfamily lysophospholipase